MQNLANKTSTAQNVQRIILGSFLIFAGTGHLSFLRTEFQAQVPAWLPMNPDRVVVLSGMVEIVLGFLLIFLARQKILAGWLAAAFFLIVFPGNIAQFVQHRNAFGLDTDLKRAIRLPFQFLLMAMALWSTGAWKAWTNKAR